MTKEEAISHIAKEFLTAEHAKNVNNNGMVRVCTRRAAGIAISFWLQSHSRQGWGRDAVHQLRALRLDEKMPQDIRNAAERLTARVTAQFSSPYTTNPMDDSKIIIDHLLENT